MSFYEWMLVLHVLAAFLTIASVVVFGTLLATTWRARTASEAGPVLRLWSLGFNLWNVGGLGTIVLGIVLAIDNGGFEPWDGWIIAAYILWAIAGGAGTRTAMGYREALDNEGATLADTVRSTRGLVLFAVMAVAVAALLVVMIYKPGA